jgi:hypothetical protein
MLLGFFPIIRFALFLWLIAMIVGAVIWAVRDAIRNTLFRWRMRRSRAKGWRPGRCLKCGYDTRANSERCSECGELLPVVRVPPRKLL